MTPETHPVQISVLRAVAKESTLYPKTGVPTSDVLGAITPYPYPDGRPKTLGNLKRLLAAGMVRNIPGVHRELRWALTPAGKRLLKNHTLLK